MVKIFVPVLFLVDPRASHSSPSIQKYNFVNLWNSISAHMNRFLFTPKSTEIFSCWNVICCSCFYSTVEKCSTRRWFSLNNTRWHSVIYLCASNQFWLEEKYSKWCIGRNVIITDEPKMERRCPVVPPPIRQPVLDDATGHWWAPNPEWKATWGTWVRGLEDSPKMQHILSWCDGTGKVAESSTSYHINMYYFIRKRRKLRSMYILTNWCDKKTSWLINPFKLQYNLSYMDMDKILCRVYKNHTWKSVIIVDTLPAMDTWLVR